MYLPLQPQLSLNSASMLGSSLNTVDAATVTMMTDGPGKRRGPCVKMLTRRVSWPQYLTGNLSETYLYLVGLILLKSDCLLPGL